MRDGGPSKLIFKRVVVFFLVMLIPRSQNTPEYYYLDTDELREYIEEANKNDIDAILRVCNYYLFSVSDYNKTFEFVSKYVNLQNNAIRHNALLMILGSKGNKSRMQKRMEVLKQLVDNKYYEAILVRNYLLGCKIIDKDYNILDINRLNKYLRYSEYEDEVKRRLKIECNK